MQDNTYRRMQTNASITAAENGTFLKRARTLTGGYGPNSSNGWSGDGDYGDADGDGDGNGDGGWDGYDNSREHHHCGNGNRSNRLW